MAHRRIRWARRALTDITQEGTQTYVAGGHSARNNIPPGTIRTTTPITTPRTPERVPSFEHPATPATWVPLTPPSLGTCTRSRSKSASPRNYSAFLDSTTPSTSSGSGTRSSPRKKLLLNSNEVIQISPKKYKLDLSTKRCPRITALHGLNNEQLVTLIETLVSDNKDLEKKLQQVLPEADLKPIEKELKYLRSCIVKSMPHGNRNSRLLSRTDSVAFSRAQIHLINFKRYMIATGTRISKSLHWSALIDFVFMAWPQVARLTQWDKAIHNDVKMRCFKFLSHQLAQAIQKECFNVVELEKLLDQALLLLVDSAEMKICVDLLQDKISFMSES